MSSSEDNLQLRKNIIEAVDLLVSYSSFPQTTHAFSRKNRKGKTCDGSEDLKVTLQQRRMI